jgi:DNA-binding MarR family transcriptional regulator
MPNPLDPILHSQLRLAIMSLLISHEEAEFVYLRDTIKTTAGNLSLQLDKLEEAGYVEIIKTQKRNYPLTKCRITKKGIKAFEKYVNDIKSYLHLE